MAAKKENSYLYVWKCFIKFHKGDIHKPREKLRGGELAEIICLNKPYFVNVTTKGEGVKILKNLTTWFMDNPYAMIISIVFLHGPFSTSLPTKL